VNGAFDIRDALETLLQINMGETTRDGIFSLEYTSCLGHCELAPVIQIDDRIYGNLNKQKLEQIIADYRRR
jgi:NADH-quinone oxidoreductase subunit E